MTAASPTQDPNEMNDHLDDLLGEAPEVDPDDRPDAEIAEPAPEPVEAKETEPEPEPEPAEAESAAEEEPEAEEEPGNLRLETPEPSDTETPTEEPDESDVGERIAVSERREAGLQKELQRLRAERRQAELAMSQRQAPMPTRPPEGSGAGIATPPPAADSNRIPVVVSEDGQSVYVDQEKLSAQMQATAHSAYQEAMRPTPAQIRQENTRQLEHHFVSRDRERNQPLFDAAQKADDFISEALIVEANRQGFRPGSIGDVQMFIRQSGIGEKVEEFFPDVAPVLDEFVAAFASDNVMWKMSVLERMGPAQAPPLGHSDSVESVSDAPRSLARKGAARSVSPSADEAEFDALEKAFRADPILFPDAKEKKMRALGKRLGISGME